MWFATNYARRYRNMFVQINGLHIFQSDTLKFPAIISLIIKIAS
jgi:hypothetical protein